MSVRLLRAYLEGKRLATFHEEWLRFTESNAGLSDDKLGMIASSW